MKKWFAAVANQACKSQVCSLALVERCFRCLRSTGVGQALDGWYLLVINEGLKPMEMAIYSGRGRSDPVKVKASSP